MFRIGDGRQDAAVGRPGHRRRASDFRRQFRFLKAGGQALGILGEELGRARQLPQRGAAIAPRSRRQRPIRYMACRVAWLLTVSRLWARRKASIADFKLPPRVAAIVGRGPGLALEGLGLLIEDLPAKHRRPAANAPGHRDLVQRGQTLRGAMETKTDTALAAAVLPAGPRPSASDRPGQGRFPPAPCSDQAWRPRRTTLPAADGVLRFGPAPVFKAA